MTNWFETKRQAQRNIFHRHSGLIMALRQLRSPKGKQLLTPDQADRYHNAYLELLKIETELEDAEAHALAPSAPTAYNPAQPTTEEP
jgi:hypothetical protein